MAAIDTLKKLPLVGRRLLFLLRMPGKFVLDPNGFRNGDPSAKEIFGWAVSFSALVLGLYSLVLGSPSVKLGDASHLLTSPVPAASAPAIRDKPVTLAGIAWIPGLSLGIYFPEQMRWTDPQLAVFSLGSVQVGINNAIPQKVVEEGLTKFLLLLYALVFVLCLHPVARLFGGKGSLRDSLRLGFIFFGFVCLLGTLFEVVAILLLVDVLRLSGVPLIWVWIGVVVIPVFTIFIRCYFGAFSAFYGITRKKLMLVGLGTYVTSSVVCPIVFLPLLFLLLRFEQLWKLVL
jgi:hypothetical protein